MSSKNKRSRDDLDEDSEVAAAAMELSSVLERALDVKLRALDRIRELIDHGDDVYTNQRILVDADAAFYIVELLSDPSPAVAMRAAQVIASIVDHSAHAKARLQSGPLIGLENSVSKVLLNPVQSDFIDAGAISLLVPWLHSATSAQSEIADEALKALCSYNYDGKVLYLASLLEATQQGHYSILHHIDELVDSLDCTSEEVDMLLERLQEPVLSALKFSAGTHTSKSALALLATVCERAPAQAEHLRGNNEAVCSIGCRLTLESMVTVEEQDIAANTLWQLVAHCSNAERASVLGPDGPLCDHTVAIIRTLQALVQTSNEEDEKQEKADADFMRRSSFCEGEEPNEEMEETVMPSVICYGDEARHLLAAMLACNKDIKFEKAEDLVARRSSCCVM